MKYAIENIYEIRHDMTELLDIHYEQVSTHKDIKKLDPKWDRFKLLTDEGVCRTATLRDDDHELVGYFITCIVPHIHFDCIMAVNDAVFVHPDHRGIAAYYLFKYAIADIKENAGADILAVHMKIHLPFDKLLAKLGFIKTEENWELVL